MNLDATVREEACADLSWSAYVSVLLLVMNWSMPSYLHNTCVCCSAYWSRPKNLGEGIVLGVTDERDGLSCTSITNPPFLQCPVSGDWWIPEYLFSLSIDVDFFSL
jgi:hypothetical protein